MLKEDNEKKRCPKIEEKMETRKSNFLLGLCYSVACGSAFWVIALKEDQQTNNTRKCTTINFFLLFILFLLKEDQKTNNTRNTKQVFSASLIVGEGFG